MAFTDAEIAEAHAAVRVEAHSDDLYRLGLIYATGQGDSADIVQAHMWFNLAAMRGSDAAKESRRDLATQMSTAEIAQAQKLAREWLSTARH